MSVVGSSGSGKTTLMNIIGCMDTPTTGSVRLDGRELGRLSASQLTDIRKNVIGLVFQQFHLIPHLTAVENVMVAQYYHSMTDRDEALHALKDVGLADRAHRLPSQLSGGEQQRVCIARALINHPELVLADEPTGNLDESNERIVLDIFRRLHASGTTLVVVTHEPTAGPYADGEYSATEDYGVVDGLIEQDSIDVTLTLRDGRITQVSVSGDGLTDTSRDFIAGFAQEVDGVVVGRSVEDAHVTVLAGVSKTSEAFNDAVDAIAEQARRAASGTGDGGC